MSQYFSELIKGLEPYVPGEQPKDKSYIKLNTNENPYPPAPEVLKRIADKANDDLRLYPDPECEDLAQTAADYYHLKKEQVFIGNGSDEVLAFCFGAFFSGKKIMFPEPTYSFYPVYANLFNVQYQGVPLEKGFEIKAEDYLRKNEGIIIPNPNAPTGRFLEIHDIEQIIQTNLENVVVIDEAYIDFGGQSCVGMVDQYPNLLVIHTLSKSRSLAGLRVGFAFGHKELIQGLNRIKNSFNSYTIDRLAEIGAIESLKAERYFQETKNKIIKTRERTVEKLLELGFDIVESKANFIFISHKKIEASIIFKKLKANSILVRYFNKPKINNYLRVSIGTDQEMATFIEAIKKIVNNNL